RVNSLSSIYSDSFKNDIDWKGSELVIKNNNWTITRNKIIKVENGKIEYNAATHYIPRTGDNYGFFIQRNINTLDSLGEWYYDGAYMNVYFGKKNPGHYVVQTSIIDTLFSNSSHHNIVVEQIQFVGANKLAIFSNHANNFTIKDCDIILSGTD